MKTKSQIQERLKRYEKERDSLSTKSLEAIKNENWHDSADYSLQAQAITKLIEELKWVIS